MSESTTPSLEVLRADWVWAQEQFGATATPAAQYSEEFDRAIAKIKADAWEEGKVAGLDMSCRYACGDCKYCVTTPNNPYEEQA